MKLKIYLWFVSVGFFLIVFFDGLWFMYKKTIADLIILLVLTAAACAFYIISSKMIKMPGGYTAVQAHRFYKSCTKEGITKKKLLKENRELLEPVLKKHNFAKDMDKDMLSKLFSDGHSIEIELKKK